MRLSGKPEDAAFGRMGRRSRVEQVQAVVDGGFGARRNGLSAAAERKRERALLAKVLVEQAELTLREATGTMGLTGAAASIQLRRSQQALPQDTHLTRPGSKIESHLVNLLLILLQNFRPGPSSENQRRLSPFSSTHDFR